MHVIGTAGHVDHGKSTLVERLTGIDPDRWAEEKRRGLTIDLGFAWLTLPSGAEIGIVDVPGHERFIKNMLAGAGGISICLFVVAANEGWMPQSAEHLSALEMLGVRHGIVALTKADTVDDEILNLAIDDVQEHLAASSLAGAPIIPCSAVTGRGIPELIATLDDIVTATPAAPDVGRARLWVDRVFTIAGAGTVVTGTLAGGSFKVGEAVELRGPRDSRGRERRARVRTIQSHKKDVESITPGHRVALNLVGLERTGAERGDAVVHPVAWQSTTIVDVVVEVLPESLSGHSHVLTEKGAHLLYIGSAETPVRVKLLGAEAVTAGDEAFAELYLRDPLPLGRGDRFVLRDAGRIQTFGGGIVLDPGPSPARRSDRRRLELLERLKGAVPDEALRALVEANGSMPRADALLRSGADNVPDGVIELGRDLLAVSAFDALAKRAREVLAAHHKAFPLQGGIPRESLRGQLGLEVDAFEDFLERVGDVVQEGAVVRLSSHRVVLNEEQERQKRKLIATLEGGGYSPPPAKELDADPKLVRAMLDASELVKIGDFYLTERQASEARRQVRAAIEAGGPMTVAQIRDLLGTTRKYAVPLCEWLDGTGTTLRRGDLRALGPNPN